MAKKIQGSIPRAKADKTNEITVTDSRTGKVKASIFTKDTQFGTPSQSAIANPAVKTYGDFKAFAGVSGSLTRLVTGESYMVAGSGITITTGSGGQVTITAGAISPASSLTMGNGFDPYNSTYNGTSPTSVAVLTETNKGIGVSSSGVKLNPGNLSSTTSATTSWEVIVANGSDPYRTTINSLLNLGINSNVTLTNPLTLNSAGGVKDTGGATQYNNTAIVDLALKIDPNKGLATTTSGLKIDPSNLSSVTVAGGDKVLIGDIDDSDNVRYVTAQSIANLATVGTLPNSLTIGNGLSPNSSAFDGSSPITVAVATADSTVSSTSSGISVLKVPNSLTSGNGIDTLDFDGSSALTIKVKAATSKGLESESSGIGLDFSNLTNSSPAAADYVAFRDYDTGAQVRTDFTTIQTNFVQPLVDASRALGTPNTLDQGTGINTFSFNGSAAGITVSVDQTTVPMLANNNTYTGVSTFTNGLSGSLTTLADGTSYIVAGSNIEITSGSNGQIVIASTASGGAVTGSISNVTQANPGVVTTVNDHNLNENQGVTITDVAGMTELNGNKYYADVLTPTTFALYSDSDLSTSLNTSAFTAYASGGKFTGDAGSGSAVAFVSGSTTVNTVDNVDITNLGILQDLGSGDVAITGSIGIAEDGSYIDGLFTDFTSQTPIGTAVDRFNEVLKGLAPSASPVLDDIDCNDSGAGAKLSFGNSQSISGYSNARPSTLTSPTSNLSDVDINGTYSSTTVSNDIRVACFNGATAIDGNLNADVPADSPNYPADAFGNGDQGILYLFVNDNSTAVHSIDLSTFGSGNTLNGNGSGFNLSAATDGSFSDGSSFSTFKHRTGTYIIAASEPDQRKGWNYARVTHVIGSSTTFTNYVEWVNDDNADALSASGASLGSLSMTGNRDLSGVKYNTGGTATYAANVDNAYKNVYSTSNITFNGTNCSNETQAFPSITVGVDDETKQLNLSQTMTINASSILNGSISTSVTVPHPLKSDLNAAGSQSISGILLYNYSDNASVTSENFRGESYRLKSGTYAAQSDVLDAANAWDSTTSLTTVDGLLFYDRKLYRPDFGGVSGDYRNTADGGSITNGPSSNVTYTSITSGTRTLYRKFQNNSGGSKSNFSITINGSGTIVDNTATLNSDKIQVFLKLPTNSSAFSTGWMDLSLAFATGQTGDNAGCLDGSFDSSLNATNNATFGTQSAGDNDWIVLKIQADATWTGNISSVSISWS